MISSVDFSSLVTMLYHDVAEIADFSSTGFTDVLADTYKLTPSDFVAHLDAIAAVRKDAPVLVNEQSKSRTNKSPWTITFDDGGVTALHPTADLLDARGWRAHYFITTGRTGTPGFLDADGVRELKQRGHLIGAHSVTHPSRMADLDDVSLLREWKESRDALESMLQAPVRVGSVPGGLYTDRVAQAAARAGLEILFNSEPTRRIRSVDGCIVLGRYAFKTQSPTQLVADLASENMLTMFNQWCTWNAKTAVKRISPSAFRVIRRLLTKH